MSGTRLYLGKIPAAGGPTAYALTALPGALTFSRQAAGTVKTLKLAATPAALTLAGATVQTKVGRTLSALPGVLTLSGQAATLSKAIRLAASPAALTFSGAVAAVKVGRTLAALPGALTLSISSAATPVGRRLAASPGSLTFTGIVAGLTYSAPSGTAYSLGGNPRALTFVGSVAALTKAMKVPAAVGGAVFSGAAATFSVGRSLTAAPATLTLTGSTANLVYVPFVGPRLYVLPADPGQLILSGASATLTGPTPPAVSWGGMGGSGGGKVDMEELTFLKEIEGKVKAGMTIEEALKVAPAIRTVPTTVQAVVKKAEKVGSNLAEIHARIAHLETALAIEKAARDDEDESELLLMIAEIL